MDQAKRRMADDGRTPKMVIRGEMRKEEETET
jgi:hypothetical protein